MASSLVVLVLVGAADVGESSTRALTTTAQTALGADAVVLVRDVASTSTISDAEASGLGERVHADAVVVVAWTSADRRHARVHVYSARSHAWADRDVSFGEADAPLERGRALGFGVASMIARDAEPSAATATPTAATTAGPSPTSTASTAAAAAGSASATPAIPSSSTPTSTARAASPSRPPAGVVRPSERAWRFVEIATSGAVGIGGTATRVGGDVAFGVGAAALAARLAAGARWGPSDPAGASGTTVRLAAGGEARAALTSNATEHPAGIGGRVAALALYERVAVGTTADARWLPGAEAMVHGWWRWVGTSELVCGVGAELAFGTTRIFLDDARVGTVPPLRLVGEIGVRLPF